MDRKALIRKNLNLNGIGLEIGPSDNPVCAKREGYHVEILDCNSKEEKLRTKHMEDRAMEFEDVDYVWKGERYAALTGKKNYYHYVIASHVIEHMVDLIVFFQDCSEIIKDDGIISLAIPDKRYEFDRFRECSSIRNVIDTHENATNRHSLGAFLDAALNSVLFETKDRSNISTMPYFAGLMSESSFQYGRYIPVLDEIMSGYSKEKEYRNCHSWVFTPASFQILIYELNLLGYIDLDVASLTTIPGRLEFFVQLKKTDKQRGFDKSKWLNLQFMRRKEELEAYQKEQALFEKMMECKKLQKNVYLYGAGEYAAQLTELFQKYDISICGYLVSDGNSHEPSFYGKPVYELSEAPIHADTDEIFLGVDSLHTDELIAQLEKKGIVNYFV